MNQSYMHPHLYDFYAMCRTLTHTTVMCLGGSMERTFLVPLPQGLKLLIAFTFLHCSICLIKSIVATAYYQPHSLAKQGDNELGSVRRSVHPSARL